MPVLLYWISVPGSNRTGVLSRAIVNGSAGGSSAFQKSPFQPVRSACGSRSCSASASPEVCEPSCWSGDPGGSQDPRSRPAPARRPGCRASACRRRGGGPAPGRRRSGFDSETRIPCFLSLLRPGGVPLVDDPVVADDEDERASCELLRRDLVARASSFAVDIPWLSGVAVRHSNGCAAAGPARVRIASVVSRCFVMEISD